MGDRKLQEYIKTLSCCSGLEMETYPMYRNLSKKMNKPESSLILAIAYDNLKTAKIIQDLITNFEANQQGIKNCKRNQQKLWQKINAFSQNIMELQNINDETFIQIFKELVILEDLLIESYTENIKSDASTILADKLSEIVLTEPSTVKKLFESIIEEKHRHRLTLIEVNYIFEKREAKRKPSFSPAVKFQNPDAWIQ
jgi:hypothetical protein